MGDPIYKTSVAWYDPGISPYRSYYMVQSGSKGDFYTPLGYLRRVCQGTAGLYEIGTESYPYYIDAPNSRGAYEGYEPSWGGHARNSAYSSFRESALGDQANVGLAIAEWKKSFNSLATAALDVGRAANDFVHGRYGDGLDELFGRRGSGRGTGRRNRTRNTDSVSKDLANRWLHWSFGVKPTLGDMKSAIDQLGEDLPVTSHRGRGQAIENSTVVNGGVRYTSAWVYSCATGARVELVNPNTFLQSELGLLNPLSVAFELIPFSFVADWVTDCGAYIESFSDFIGCRVTRQWQSHKVTYFDSEQYVNYSGRPAYARGVTFRRLDGLIYPYPNLNVEANLGNNITRAANACALASQAVGGMRDAYNRRFGTDF